MLFIRLNGVDGREALTEGQERGAVTFSTYLRTPPKSVRVSLELETEMNIFATVVAESVGPDGFAFELSAPIPAGAAYINYQIDI